MGNKNLKAVETEIRPYLYAPKQMSDIADHLYFCKSVLAVLADLDPKQPDAFESGDVANLALEGKIRLAKAIELLHP